MVGFPKSGHNLCLHTAHEYIAMNTYIEVVENNWLISVAIIVGRTLCVPTIKEALKVS